MSRLYTFPFLSVGSVRSFLPLSVNIQHLYKFVRLSTLKLCDKLICLLNSTVVLAFVLCHLMTIQLTGYGASGVPG